MKRTTPSDNGKLNPSPQTEDRPILKCYVSGAPGFIRAEYPTCNPVIKTESSHFEQIQIYTCSTATTLLHGVHGNVCVGTGFSHSLGSETVYSVLKEQSVKFEQSFLNVSLRTGQRSKEDSLTTNVTVEIEERKIRTDFLVLSKAK